MGAQRPDRAHDSQYSRISSIGGVDVGQVEGERVGEAVHLDAAVCAAGEGEDMDALEQAGLVVVVEKEEAEEGGEEEEETRGEHAGV